MIYIVLHIKGFLFADSTKLRPKIIEGENKIEENVLQSKISICHIATIATITLNSHKWCLAISCCSILLFHRFSISLQHLLGIDHLLLILLFITAIKLWQKGLTMQITKPTSLHWTGVQNTDWTVALIFQTTDQHDNP